MRLPGVGFLALLSMGLLAAQSSSVGGFGNVVFPGLGHAPRSTNPWGNVVSPAIPQGAATFASGLKTGTHCCFSGLVPGFRSNGGAAGNGRHRVSSVYVFPAYIGGYGYPYAPVQSDQPVPDAGVNSQAQPPVVINNYYGLPAGDQPQPGDEGASNFHFYQSPANTEAAPSDTPYYLIAFKDHTIYSAVAYYTEGSTLHYFTAGNVHNQVSLSLVDRELTEQLNRNRNVEVKLP